MQKTISIQTLRRLPAYLHYLRVLKGRGTANVSATMIAGELKLNDVQVRKDLAVVSGSGRPKTGYEIEKLISDIECCLGCGNADTAVIIGAGKLGCALLTYKGFLEYGIDIVAAFDIDRNIIDTTVNGKQVFSVEKLPAFCSEFKINIGIITVGANDAQKACNMLIENGVTAIWNFAPVHLAVPSHVLVQDENLGSSLAILSKHLAVKSVSDKKS
ncbi:redox-sensing transcriptional repressor Rex [Anaerocolumna xylanovorans]|uniref:Redox-sensing transcriptional repressor Rex n=1 Tax=Anaerocolumna xylanovorans DSM 12503 TaxID=1121345 RepID=A0A1M7XYL8_9FIRM|nr:redox-sensing transcriptional repressor Rex [Anaerocolumna xylanovorans]SHO44114.1 redox-sensing transcriptional repressor [Anaerocolumna xylanovorans DSM 12503]